MAVRNSESPKVGNYSQSCVLRRWRSPDMVTAGCDTRTLGKVKERELDAGSVAESELLEF